ncbi:MAG: hypothetical protein MJZ67_03115 [Bacteroidales bacterium]|nr:hypothetical protein [Bacteroidales bacterium]
MKNIFKFFSIALAAGSMMFASCGEKTPEGTDPEQPTTYTVTVNANDATLGTVTINPQQESYAPGTEVTVVATPAANANFLNWNGSITDNPYTFTVNANTTLTANFEAKPQATFSATLGGSALELGWCDAACADLTSQAGAWMWLFQAAKEAEGTSVYFPYIVNYLLGSSTNTMALYNIELYKDTYYTASGNQYGDWQFYADGSETINCSALDLTAHTMSCTMSANMYSLTDVVENSHASDGSESPKAVLALTFSNVEFALESKGLLKKMNVR